MTRDEQFLPIPNYNGMYSVSTTGQVRSEARLCRGKGNSMRPVEERVLKPDVDRDGYLCVRLSRDGRKTKHLVHRLVLSVFVGPCLMNQQSRHLDGNPSNNNIANLIWGTSSENYNDRRLHGTDNSGKRNGRYRHGRRMK